MTQESPHPTLDHFLLTRFNVRWRGYQPTGVDPVWLAHRFEIFERFCLPSVRGQTEQGFRWLVFFDQATPEDYRRRIEEYVIWPNLLPVFLPEWSIEAARSAIASYRRPAAETLITSRLDNDDAISSDFISAVQREASTGFRGFLNFPDGFQWHEGRLYRLRHWSNSFASLIESAPEAEFETILGVEHMQIIEAPAVRQIVGPARWLQVVHERNLLNRVLGVRHPARELLLGFALDPSLAPEREPALPRLLEWGYGTGLMMLKKILWRLRKPGERRVIEA